MSVDPKTSIENNGICNLGGGTQEILENRMLNIRMITGGWGIGHLDDDTHGICWGKCEGE